MNLISFSILLALLFSLSLHRSLGDGDIVKEKTLAIVKPDGLLRNYTKLIKDMILDAGFVIRSEKTVQLDLDTVGLFYSEHSLRSFFPGLVNYMTSGPVLIMVLEKANAVSDWRALIGPTDASKAKVTNPQSIRAICGLDLQRNCVHGSDSLTSAAREISILFNETSSVSIFLSETASQPLRFVGTSDQVVGKEEYCGFTKTIVLEELFRCMMNCNLGRKTYVPYSSVWKPNGHPKETK